MGLPGGWQQPPHDWGEPLLYACLVPQGLPKTDLVGHSDPYFLLKLKENGRLLYRWAGVGSGVQHQRGTHHCGLAPVPASRFIHAWGQQVVGPSMHTSMHTDCWHMQVQPWCGEAGCITPASATGTARPCRSSCPT